MKFISSKHHRVWVLGLWIFSAFCALGEEPEGVFIQDLEGKLRIEILGKLFTEYHYLDVQKPYFYPVIGPSGASVTRHFPMKNFPDEVQDHPHHTSLWYAHGDVNGYNFWETHPIIHDQFIDIHSGPEKGWFTALNHWVTKSGNLLFEEERKVTVYASENPKIMDFNITFKASHGDLILGDTKDGSLALRLAPTLQISGRVGQGKIINSEGDEDSRAWGKRARWVDYSGLLGNVATGITMMDHPANPRHPTWWHVRPYGLFAANPFGVHHFDKLPRNTGDMRIPEGEKVTFKYRILFHLGDLNHINTDQAFQAFIGQ